MAYDDTKCPCGGQKLRETMLCDLCEAHLAERMENRILHNPENSWESRRGAAIRLIAMARQRPKLARVMQQAEASRAFRLEHGYV